jgi:hypothetical protein
MNTSRRRSLAASSGLLALAAAAVLATQGAHAQASGGGCGEGGGNLCKQVKTCLFTECVTVSNYYKPSIE